MGRPYLISEAFEENAYKLMHINNTPASSRVVGSDNDVLYYCLDVPHVMLNLSLNRPGQWKNITKTKLIRFTKDQTLVNKSICTKYWNTTVLEQIYKDFKNSNIKFAKTIFEALPNSFRCSS